MLTENPNKCLFPNPDFIYDEACLDVYNELDKDITIGGQYNECDGCEFQKLTTLAAGANTSLIVNTKYGLELNYTIANSSCRYNTLFLEHYRYGWNISNKCSTVYIKEAADSAYLPILTAFIVLFSFGTVWYMVKCIYKCTKNNEKLRKLIFWSTELENVRISYDLGSPGSAALFIERAPPLRKFPNRVKAIDTFRGLCIMLMIFVDYGGGKYWFFNHSIWNGLTIADLVFPWFVWLMGLSSSIWLNSKLRRAVPRRQLFMHIVRRSVILMFVGFVINSHGKTVPLTEVRLPGVLPRLGISYLIAGIIETAFAKRSLSVNEYGRLSFLQDIVVAIPQWFIMGILLLVHLLITFLLDVPGCGRGYLGPGGLHDLGRHANCTGGAAGYIDRMVFGDHMDKNPTCMNVYESRVNYDPEGILGIFTSVILTYFGIQAGRILNTYSNVKTRVIRWVTWGILMGIIGGLLCNFSKNEGVIPVNKNLWSLSFILVVGAMAFLIHAFLFTIVDIHQKWGGRPLFYPGMNSIILYIGHEVFRNTFPFAWTPVNKTHMAFLSMNLWGLALWVVIAITLYKRNLFFTI